MSLSYFQIKFDDHPYLEDENQNISQSLFVIHCVSSLLTLQWHNDDWEKIRITITFKHTNTYIQTYIFYILHEFSKEKIKFWPTVPALNYSRSLNVFCSHKISSSQMIIIKTLWAVFCSYNIFFFPDDNNCLCGNSIRQGT